MIKHLIKQKVDLECEHKNGWRPLHFACRYSTAEVIKIMVEQNVNLESKTKTNARPIHILCKHSTLEMIKYFVDKGVDLECETEDKWRPIHCICRFSNEETILYAMTKFNTDVRCSNYENKAVNYSIVDLMKMNPLVSKEFLNKYFYNEM